MPCRCSASAMTGAGRQGGAVASIAGRESGERADRGGGGRRRAATALPPARLGLGVLRRQGGLAFLLQLRSQPPHLRVEDALARGERLDLALQRAAAGHMRRGHPRAWRRGSSDRAIRGSHSVRGGRRAGRAQHILENVAQKQNSANGRRGRRGRRPLAAKRRSAGRPSAGPFISRAEAALEERRKAKMVRPGPAGGALPPPARPAASHHTLIAAPRAARPLRPA
jgi:hypothetical protein